MSGGEKRNHLVDVMHKRSSNSFSFINNMDNNTLVGFAYISFLLESKGIFTQNQLVSRKHGKQRTKLIDEISKNMFCFDIYEKTKLETNSDIDLYNKGIRLRGKMFFWKHQLILISYVLTM